MSGPGYLVPYAGFDDPFSDAIPDYASYTSVGPCATCGLLYQFNGGDFMADPSNVAAAIVGIISLFVMIFCMLRQKRLKVGTASYQGAWFFASIHFALLVADAFQQGEDAVVTGSYPIIYVFILAAYYAASILAYVTMIQLTREATGNAGLRRFLSSYNRVTVALLSIFATIDVALDIYLTVGVISNYVYQGDYYTDADIVVVIVVKLIWSILFWQGLLVLAVFSGCMPRPDYTWAPRKRIFALLAIAIFVLYGMLGTVDSALALAIDPDGTVNPYDNSTSTSSNSTDSGNNSTSYLYPYDYNSTSIFSDSNSTSSDGNSTYSGSNSTASGSVLNDGAILAYALATPIVQMALLALGLLFENLMFGRIVPPRIDPEVPMETEVITAPKLEQ